MSAAKRGGRKCLSDRFGNLYSRGRADGLNYIKGKPCVAGRYTDSVNLNPYLPIFAAAGEPAAMPAQGMTSGGAVGFMAGLAFCCRGQRGQGRGRRRAC